MKGFVFIALIFLFAAGCIDTGVTDYSSVELEQRDITGRERAEYLELWRCLKLDTSIEPFPEVIVAEQETIICGGVQGAFGCTIDPDIVVIDERFVEQYQVIRHEFAHVLEWRANDKPDKHHKSETWDGSCGVGESVIVEINGAQITP